jgi:hypothetical protein
MSVSLTYPGVYIEELPSGVHTITGVATSIAAFVGWASQGPVTQATLVTSFSEYATLFGGLDSRTTLGYAVNQFFTNGGQQCYIARLVWTDAVTASGTVGGSLNLYASNPGQWADNLLISVTTQPSGRFSILVQITLSNGQVQTLESFVNLSISPTDPLYVVTVIDSDSNYITFVNPATPDTPPAAPLTAPTSTPPLTPASLSNAGNDGTVLQPTDGQFESALLPVGPPPLGGVYLLNQVEIFNLLCVPGETDTATISTLQTYCADQRAFLIVDAPQLMTEAELMTLDGPGGTSGGSFAAFSGSDSANAAYYFPWVSAPDPLFGNRPTLFPPCGFVAGIYAATDAGRGVWKAPAGIDAALSGEYGLQYVLADADNGNLNPLAINCLRHFRVYGDVVWGARTMAGADQMGSQWKYVPIRRLALFLESSLYDGTQWVVFEPNDERLWGQIRLNVGSFMQGLFLQGAFAGTTPQQAYFVKCDAENNPDSSVALGVVNVLVGFAPLYPAEFVVIQIQQIAGQGS